ncbi:MAG TPA: hypothetical protein VGC41_23730 [Kofleriaceae bacterium]
MLSGESALFETGQETYQAEMAALPPAPTTVTDETVNACFADDTLVTDATTLQPTTDSANLVSQSGTEACVADTAAVADTTAVVDDAAAVVSDADAVSPRKAR